MGSETIDIARMGASCVELLFRLGMSTDQIARTLRMSAEDVASLGDRRKPADIRNVPHEARPPIQRMSAVQSFLLSMYSPESMVEWFHHALPGTGEIPAVMLVRDGEPAISRVLQAAIGRACS